MAAQPFPTKPTSPVTTAKPFPRRGGPTNVPAAVPPPNNVDTLHIRMTQQENNMRSFYNRLGAVEMALQGINGATINHKAKP